MQSLHQCRAETAARALALRPVSKGEATAAVDQAGRAQGLAEADAGALPAIALGCFRA